MSDKMEIENNIKHVKYNLKINMVEMCSLAAINTIVGYNTVAVDSITVKNLVINASIICVGTFIFMNRVKRDNMLHEELDSLEKKPPKIYKY